MVVDLRVSRLRREDDCFVSPSKSWRKISHQVYRKVSNGFAMTEKDSSHSPDFVKTCYFEALRRGSG